MNREQVFLAVLSGVVARGPLFKRRRVGECGPLEVNYELMIKITNNVTDAVMNHVGLKQQMERSMTKESNTEDILRDMVECYKDRIKELQDEIESLKSGKEFTGLAERLRQRELEVAGLHGERMDLRQKVEAMEKIAEAHRVSAIKMMDAKDVLQKEVDRLKEEIAAEPATWHHLREVEKELQNAKIGLKAVSDVVVERDATIEKLQADKDALRKAVEDGAMEIERLRNTLKGVEQIASMKPEDVEALKVAWEKIEKDGGAIQLTPFVIKHWSMEDYVIGNGEHPPVNPLIDIKNDLSSAVANSTEGQRVVVEDLEATVEGDPEEWVMITDPEHVLRECDWLGADCIPESFITAKGADAVGKRAGIYIAEPHPMFLRCRRKDLPVVEVKGAEVVAEEDPEEWVVIVDPDHILRAGDEMTATSNFNGIENCLQKARGDCGGWLCCEDFGHAGRKAGLSMGPGGMTYRCKRKDLPVTSLRLLLSPQS